MLYLRTGANGSCKTLFTLWDVRKLQLETNRPVCINGRFKIKPEKLAEFGWRVIEFKDWEDQPDGTIFLIDECHNDLPVRPNSSAVPKPVKMLAEHRARGFDFFLLTQHPMNIDMFVRKLIGAPGWHQHLKRQFGATNRTTVLQWDAVNTTCEKDGSGKTAQKSVRTHPKEVYGWYDSAELHTGKVRIPKQVYWLIFFIVAIIISVVLVVYRMKSSVYGDKPPDPPKSSQAAPSQSSGSPPPQAQERTLSPADYAASYQPRIAGLPYTAPRYDGITSPSTAPYPAACVSMGSRCDCYSQQGTKLDSSPELCKQIVQKGFFMDWESNKGGGSSSGGGGGGSQAKQPIQGSPGQIAEVQLKPEPVATDALKPVRDGQMLASMRAGGRAVSSY